MDGGIADRARSITDSIGAAAHKPAIDRARWVSAATAPQSGRRADAEDSPDFGDELAAMRHARGLFHRRRITPLTDHLEAPRDDVEPVLLREDPTATMLDGVGHRIGHGRRRQSFL